MQKLIVVYLYCLFVTGGVYRGTGSEEHVAYNNIYTYAMKNIL
jgi:hypothetical protein